jgi:hypothetical protein
MALIVHRCAKRPGLRIDDAAASETGRRSNGAPGNVKGLLRRVRDYAEVHSDGVVTVETVTSALDLIDLSTLLKRSPVKPVDALQRLPPVEAAASEAMNELPGLTGLDAVKRDVVSLANFIRINRLRAQAGLARRTSRRPEPHVTYSSERSDRRQIVLR